MKTTEEDFRRVLLETVESTLHDVLGEKIKRALTFYVDFKYSIRNPARFFAVIFELVGPKQSETLKEQIVTRLYQKYGLTPSNMSISLEIEALKSQIIR